MPRCGRVTFESPFLLMGGGVTATRRPGGGYEDKMARTGIRVGDLFDEAGFRAALEANLREKNAYPQALLRETPLSFDDIHDRYVGYRDALRPFVTDTGVEVRAALAAKKRVLLEGAQGVMLDVDHGPAFFGANSLETRVLRELCVPATKM